MAEARLHPHGDAVIAGIHISLVTELADIARRNAGLAHGDQRAAKETKMGNFWSNTRDRTREHYGVSTSSIAKVAKTADWASIYFRSKID